MAPEKALYRIWAEAFNACLIIGCILTFVLPHWSVLYSIALALLLPAILTGGVHMVRERQYR